MAFDPNDMFQVAQATKDHGLPFVAKSIIGGCQEETLVYRRKAALFVANLLGHNVSAKTMVEQPAKVITQCANCQMVAKIGRESGVEGRLIERECPASGPRS